MECLVDNLMDFNTYFNEQVLTQKPIKMAIDLPSQFQIGDRVELVFDDFENVVEDVYIYGIRFAGNGTVAYDLAIPTTKLGIYTIANHVRGYIRLSGSSKTVDELKLTPIEEILPLVKRSLFKVIK